MMTPEPKYFVNMNAHPGTLRRGCRVAIIGKRAPGAIFWSVSVLIKSDENDDDLPNVDPIKMTNTEDILNPSRPS